MSTHKTLSQQATRESLGSPDSFKGGVWVTKNGTAELFVQTALERQEELAAWEQEQQTHALLKLVLKSKQEVAEGKVLTPDEALKRLRATRG
ncbi:hypothetical protein [Serratia fonticola]|jgi:hypothetical protein|uniref:hypothetical protein n=1 Tax=Serratia fonticola TaxID=47917 RepID=UPI0024DE6A58|nr:hypothetical protein [Serratia fonticola]MDK2377908.1 hypothetical protein [Serratia fonticola]